MRSILEKLAGGDRRSIWRSNGVVKEVHSQPETFPELFAGLRNRDYLVRMRAADAIEKITLQRPLLLQPYKRQLLELAGQKNEKEPRWHMAQILPRLELSARHRAAALDILFEYLRDTSSIVKTFAMQAIADLAAEDKVLAAKVLPMIRQLTEIGTPAMRARGRNILRQWTPQAASGKRRALSQK